MKFLASVIIPTYNRKELLAKTLLSLTKQNISKENFEVIICDDGSTDNTTELVDSFKKELHIKYFYQEDKGFRAAKARNTGIKNADGDICIFIDAGCIAKGDFIENHLKCHIDDEKTVVIGYAVGFSQHNKEEDHILSLLKGDNIEDSIIAMKKAKLIDIRERVYGLLGEELNLWQAPWTIFWTVNVSVKRNFLIQCGGFDEWFDTWGGEDTELGVNLFINGGIYKLARNAVVIHYPHEKSNNIEKDPRKAAKEQIKKRRYIYNKYKIIDTLAYMYMNTLAINSFLDEYKKLQNSEGEDSNGKKLL